MGLLLPHKSTVSVFPDMVSVAIQRDNSNRSRGKRNEIKTFSKESRYRLFRLIHSIRFTRISFVTLTYGKTYPGTGILAKKDLKAFRRATERRWGTFRVIWRMEYQKRGAPHFHLLCFDAPFIPIQDWCSVWDKARHAPAGEIFGNSLDCKINAEAKGADVVSKYLGKYVAKPAYPDPTDARSDQGRIWGKWNIEESKPLQFELYPMEAEQLARMLLEERSEGEWRPSDHDCYTLFGSKMGTDEFGQTILNLLQNLLTKTRRVEGRKVTIDTSILV